MPFFLCPWYPIACECTVAFWERFSTYVQYYYTPSTVHRDTVSSVQHSVASILKRRFIITVFFPRGKLDLSGVGCSMTRPTLFPLSVERRSSNHRLHSFKCILHYRISFAISTSISKKKGDEPKHRSQHCADAQSGFWGVDRLEGGSDGYGWSLRVRRRALLCLLQNGLEKVHLARRVGESVSGFLPLEVWCYLLGIYENCIVVSRMKCR